MSDAIRDLFMSVGFNGASAIKGLDGLNKKADGTKEKIQGIGEKTTEIGAVFQSQMAGLDKNFRLWETNAGKLTTALEKKQRRIELLKDKSYLLGKEIDRTNGELKESVQKYGEGSEAAQKLENQLLDLKIQQAEYNKELKNLSGFDWDGLDRLGDKLGKIGGVMTATVTAPIKGIGIVGTKTFIELEDSFACVEKTVNATDEEIHALRGSLNDLVTKGGIPIDVKEMYGIAEAAGQLGIKTKNITGFSEVMAKLGTATNMASEQAATDLAQFANITQMPQENFDRLGSTIVGLGNNLATTESKITGMGLRLSGAGKQIGLTESEILGFSGALSSVGIEEEAGGTAFSKVMLGIQNAVMEGGEELDVFSATAGKTVEEFKQVFERDAASAIIEFTEGLGKLQKDGFNTNTILEELGFSDARVSDALRRAANSGDVFRNAISLANKEWEENTALNEEAEKKYEKNASKIEVFKNKLTLLSEKIGGDLIGRFGSLLDIGNRVVDWLSSLDDESRKNIVGIGTAVSAIGPAFLGLSLGVKAVKGIHNTITDLGKGLKIMKSGFLGFGKAIGFLTSPVGLTIAAIGALIVIGALLYKNWDKISQWLQNKFPTAFVKITGAINGFKQFLSSNTDNFKLILSGFSDFVSGIFSGNLSLALNGLGDMFKGTFAVLANICSVGLTNLFGPDATDGIKQTFNGLIDFIVGVFTGDWEKAWLGVNSVFGQIFGLLGGLIKAPMNAVIGIINSAIKGINGIKVDIPSWVPGMGGQTLGFSIPSIPMLAKGTDFFKGGPALVGEEGPEIVNLNRGDSVTPFEKTKSLLAEIGRAAEAFSSKLGLLSGSVEAPDRENSETLRQYRYTAPPVNTESIFARLGRDVREQMPQRYSLNDYPVSGREVSCGKSGMTPKVEIKIDIDEIVVGGELKRDAADNMRRQFSNMFQDAWEDAWYKLCLKHPNLTES